jgi:CHAT domain-containing protein/TolA-binding protein
MARHAQLSVIHTTALASCVVLLASLFAGRTRAAAQSSEAKATNELVALEPNKTAQIEVASGERKAYIVELAPGQYASVLAACDGAGATIVLRDTSGAKINELKANETGVLKQTIEVVAELAGRYRVDIESESKVSSVVCSAQLTVPRPASEKELWLHQARTLFFTAFTLINDGKFDEAVAPARQALTLREKALEPGDPAIGGSSWQLGQIVFAKGDYPAAESLFLSALRVFEKAQGTDSRSVTALVSNLGTVYQKMGDLDKAEAYLKRAVGIFERLNIPNDPMLADALHDLALVYNERADYNEAERLYRREIVILEHVFGPDHPEVADPLVNLAGISLLRGDYVGAQSLARRSLIIYEKAFGLEDYRTGYALAALANVAFDLEDLQSAESRAKQAISAFEKTLGREHPDVANNLTTLAMIYHERKEFAKAEPLYLEALAARRKKLGEIHAETAESFGALANLYRDEGQYARAESYYQTALDVREKTIGPEHPEFAETLTDFSILQMAESHFAEAESLLSRAIAISERNADLNLRAGSERQKLAYMKLLSSQLDEAITLNALLAPEQSAARDLAVATVLQRKGRVQELLADNLKSMRQRADADDAKLLDELDGVTTQLARLVLTGPQHTAIEVHQARLAALKEDRDRLEARVSERSAEFRATSQHVALDQVRAALGQDSALLEFVAYRKFRPSEPTEKARRGESRYIVYVIRSKGDVQWKDLGDANSLDKLIDDCRQALRDPARADVKRLARALYDRLFQPLQPLLGEASHLLISPDGNLSLLPIEMLLDGQQRFLVERYSITYLTAGRDLIRMQVPRESKSGPVLMADPAFGEPGGTLVAKAEGSRTQLGRNLRRSITSADDLSSVYFAPLAGTAEEARAIHTLFPDATVLTSTRASKTALKRLQAPSLLHIATHGFFLNNPEDESRNFAASGTRAIHATPTIDNPLLRSGLAFSGANLAKTGKDDGLLTALEAAGLNLWGTKLVTLSACDTGVGEIRTGEGVYGLRRAFFLAGTESLVMSLWPVSDTVTREIMTSYYSGLRRGLGRGEALRQAELAMLKRPSRRHPFYWASFIESGAWSPLAGQSNP